MTRFSQIIGGTWAAWLVCATTPGGLAEIGFDPWPPQPGAALRTRPGLQGVGEAPVITVAPEDVAAEAGQTVGFGVKAEGAAPLHYQWFHEGVAVPGATNYFLVLVDVRPADEGVYGIEVSNGFGTTNAAAALTLTRPEEPPVITVPPEDATVDPGATVGFGVKSVGTPPLGYRWFHDGAALAGATNYFLVLPDVGPTDAGEYRVEVSNAFGTARAGSNPDGRATGRIPDRNHRTRGGTVGRSEVRRVGLLTWKDSGESERGLGVGGFGVEFKPLPGWQTPAEQTVTIRSGEAVTATGAYVRWPSLAIGIPPCSRVTPEPTKRSSP